MQLFLPSSVCPNSSFCFVLFCLGFFPSNCTGTSLLETWTSTKTLSSVSNCLRQYSPGTSRQWLRGAKANSWANAGFTVVTEVYEPITQCMGGHDSSWAPWCMVLNPTAPTEMLLSMDGNPTLTVGGGGGHNKRRHIRPCGYYHSSFYLQFRHQCFTWNQIQHQTLYNT